MHGTERSGILGNDFGIGSGMGLQEEQVDDDDGNNDDEVRSSSTTRQMRIGIILL